MIVKSKKRIAIVVGVLAIVVTMSVGNFTNVSAMAAEGCIITPGKEIGDCEKNTEGGYTCIPDGWWNDCTKSMAK